MPYLTHRERLAIIYALAVAATVIIIGTSVLGAIGGLTCPINTFC
jgi:hypothetical protein